MVEYSLGSLFLVAQRSPIWILELPLPMPFFSLIARPPEMSKLFAFDAFPGLFPFLYDTLMILFSPCTTAAFHCSLYFDGAPWSFPPLSRAFFL